MSEVEVEKVILKGQEYAALADGKYDVIVLGTGLKECILSGMLAKIDGKRVLQLDRNGYYGSHTASLDLDNLYKKFLEAEADGASDEFKAKLGDNRDYNVDLIPKFIMANGKLVKMMVHTDVTKYLSFQAVDGSYVYKKGGKTGKVPANEVEALKTGLVGFFQKRKLKNFLQFVGNFKEDTPSTHGGFDVAITPAKAIYDKYGLDENTQQFIGHALCLFTNDSYLQKPAIEMIRACHLYAMSLDRAGQSPYVYPLYGLGGLSEGFSRVCAVHGGVYMLNREPEQIIRDDDGKAIGVTSIDPETNEMQAATCDFIIGEPSYFPPENVKSSGKIIRSIFVLDHPVAGVKNAGSAQLIIPQGQVGRRNNIYVSVLSEEHRVSGPSRWLAIASTTAETDNPVMELNPAAEMLGDAIFRFDSVLDMLEPVNDAAKDGSFITKSYDATSHFETVSQDVLDLYESAMGKPLDMTIKAELQG